MQSRQNPVVLGVTLAKVNDRLAVWRQEEKPVLWIIQGVLAKVNDRLAVWRLFFFLLLSCHPTSCKSERPLSGLETFNGCG